MRGYLAKRFATASAATANLEKKILSSFFRSCIKNQVLKENPVFPVRSFKVSAKDKAERRAFTVEEIQLLYSKAPDDFWRFMVLAGFYSGLRLGDLVLLRLGEIDFQDNVLRLVSGKAGKRMIIPMAAPLRKLLAEITAPLPVNDPARRLWPEKAKLYEDRGSDPISKEFRNLLLVPAGLAAKRNHRKAKNGRDAAREVGGPSFHCMRHSFVSFLKATGSNPAIARELAGHSSDMVNNLYTHIPQTALSEAINKLPMLSPVL